MSAASAGANSQEPPDTTRADALLTRESPSRMRVWTLEITPRHRWLHLPLKEIWDYRDLLGMLVKRDIVTQYKQTILGPIWFLLQPILTTLMFIVVFGNIANIPTDGVPPVLFYLSGIVVWNYFADTFLRTAGTFVNNVEIFGKVYFPRLVVPLSFAASGLVKFFIQLGIFLVIYAVMWIGGASVRPSPGLLLIPYFVLLMALLGLAGGVLFSAVTAKYRDLNFVVQFGVQLLMYATPIIYPMGILSPRLKSISWWNPLSHLVEGMRYGFFGVGELTWAGLAYSTVFTTGLLLFGILIFHRTEQDFMDTV